MASRYDSNGSLSPWTDDWSRCITTSPVPIPPQPWALVEEDHHHARSPGRARAGCRWSTDEYARLMSSVRHSRKAADSKGRPVVLQFATLVSFRGLDLWTIWGVQLPACLPHA